MIKRINSIKNFAIFKDFTWHENLQDFKKLNIFYGRNYSGKTTLSRIFRAIETESLPKHYDNIEFELEDDKSIITESNLASFEGKVRVFNEDFVREHLKFLTDPNAEIESFAILGDKNIEIQDKIDSLEQELGSNEAGKETDLYKIAKDAEVNSKKFTTEFTKLTSAYNDTLKKYALTIKNNFHKFGDHMYHKGKLSDEIQYVLSSKYSEISLEQKSLYEDIIKENVQPYIQSYNLLIQFEEYCNKAEALLVQKIGTSNKIQELLLNTALNNWVKEGANFLAGQDTCAFCGNHISKERWQEIYAHFDEESQQLENQLNELIQEINNEQEKLVSSFNELKEDKFYKEYTKNFQECKNQFNAYIATYQEALNLIIAQLEKRKEQITVDIIFDKPQFDINVLPILVDKLNSLIAKNNDYTSNLDSKKKEAQKALRFDEVNQFCKYNNMANRKENIHQLELEKDKAVAYALGCIVKVKDKEQELEKTRRQLNDEEEGASRVNQYLNNYFAHREIALIAEKNENIDEKEQEKQIRFKIMRGDKPAYNLSEGECSLISFCYFIAKLEDIKTSNSKPIIWIDDPISSLDSNHIYYIYSLIYAKIKKENCEQLFISTHNLDFLHYLKQFSLISNKAEHKQYFLIERDGYQKSNIKQMPEYLKEYATEFNYLFSIIYNCSQCKSLEDKNYNMLYSFANNARKFLEIYLYFKYPNTKTRPLKNLSKFFETERIPPILTNRFINEGSHGVSPERMLKIDIDVETIRNVARKILEKLEKHDKEQYQELLTSIHA